MTHSELAEPIAIRFTVTLKHHMWSTKEQYDALIEGGYTHEEALAEMARDWQQEFWADFYDEQVVSEFLHLGRPDDVAPEDMPTVAGPARSSTDPCPECKGEGVYDQFVDVYTSIEGSDLLTPLSGPFQACLNCGGTGRVLKKVSNV